MRFRTSFLLLLIAAAGLAQTPQVESDEVNRVGSHIACQCGGCKESVSCPMSKRGCGFCAPQKARIFKMQQSGMSDDSILAVYRKEFGDKIYLSDPSPFYWIVPLFATCLGVLAIYWFLRRFIGHAPARMAPADPALSRFHDQIERETANLD